MMVQSKTLLDTLNNCFSLYNSFAWWISIFSTCLFQSGSRLACLSPLSARSSWFLILCLQDQKPYALHHLFCLLCSVLSTWQLRCNIKFVNSSHQLPPPISCHLLSVQILISFLVSLLLSQHFCRDWSTHLLMECGQSPPCPLAWGLGGGFIIYWWELCSVSLGGQ